MTRKNWQMIEEINRLRKEENAVILAHYYQTGDIQDIADFVGDSFALSRRAKDTDADSIVFCGVLFMAESAKILSPQKKVLLPVWDAGCPMADMVTPDDVMKLRGRYPDAAVVCYVNSSCAVKAVSDVCVTSANAVKIVKALEERQIIFVPDQNLGSYVARQAPEKEIILHPGYCHVHHQLTAEDVDRARAAMPSAVFLAHPECTQAVLEKADFIGSTAQILRYATESKETEFLIGTEAGILHALEKSNPDKVFRPLTPKLICADMKKTRLADVRDALLHGQHEIKLDEDVMNGARRCLDRMLLMASRNEG
jgi:quinolinate synthase